MIRPAAANTRRERLRGATRAEHACLDQLVDTRRYFTNPSLYREWLRRMGAFHREVSSAIADSPVRGGLPLAAFMQRTTLLHHDLADLEYLGDEVDWPHSPTLGILPPRTLADAFGMLYVVEGAALGARILLVKAHHLGMTERRGARQLAYAARDFADWHLFVARLDELACTPSEELAMETTARRTFSCAATHMSRRI